MRPIRIVPAILFAMLLFFLATISMNNPLRAQSPTPTPYPSFGSGNFFLPPYPSNANRMGFGKASNDDAGVLNAGWYLDWGAATNPPHPGGAEYGRTIYLHTHDTGTLSCGRKAPAVQLNQITPTLTDTALIDRVQSAPGALWMVGNEPDSIYNGSPIQAELYAELYHYFYTTIKAADPTAKVAIGAIVQPSPLRMEYLDKVLTQYQTLYGEPLPVDVWNIHFYRLNEGPCGSWGAAVPPFSSSSYGWSISFSASELLNVDKLETALRDFRQWMADRGYGNVPLIITEFGVLPPPSYSGFSNDTAAQFLDDMFNMMLTATDPATGLAVDGNRLVQAWAWYSTRDTAFGYGGNLFNSNGTLTVIGDRFVAQTAAHFTPYVDLQSEPAAGETPLGGYITNRGNITATGVTAQASLTDYFSGAISRTETYTIPTIAPRYRQPPVFIGWVETPSPPYVYTFTITADPFARQTQESNWENNRWQTTLVAFPDLSVDGISAPVIPLSGGSSMMVPAITVTVRNTGNWTSTATALQLQGRKSTGAILYSRTYTIPPLAINEPWQLSDIWGITGTGYYLFTATVNPAQLPYVDWNAANNRRTVQILLPDDWIYLPLVQK